MDKKLKEKIEKSGNNLHIDVANRLSISGWGVEVSSYYVDDISTAPREIDIIAHKTIDIAEDRQYDGDMGNFKVFLLIECKHIKKDIAFRLFGNKRKESEEAIYAIYMDKDKLINPNYGAFSSHHYFNTEIAKLHDVIDNGDEKSVFSALTQPIKSLIFESEKDERGLYYPVAVYEGIDGIYSIKNNMSNVDDAIKEKQMIYGLHYAYCSPVHKFMRQRMFYVDFIHVEVISKYLEQIESEVAQIRNSLYYEFLSKNGQNR